MSVLDRMGQVGPRLPAHVQAHPARAGAVSSYVGSFDVTVKTGSPSGQAAKHKPSAYVVGCRVRGGSLSQFGGKATRRSE